MRFVAVFADGTATLTQIKGAGILADADSITEPVRWYYPNETEKSTDFTGSVPSIWCSI